MRLEDSCESGDCFSPAPFFRHSDSGESDESGLRRKTKRRIGVIGIEINIIIVVISGKI